MYDMVSFLVWAGSNEVSMPEQRLLTWWVACPDTIHSVIETKPGARGCTGIYAVYDSGQIVPETLKGLSFLFHLN